MINRNSQQGFTLIELIVVIVILGILAVTAAPKFISFTADASKSALQGIQGGILGGMNMTNARAIVDGKDATADVGLVSGVDMSFGYPTATLIGIVAAAGINASADGAKEMVYIIVGNVMTIAQSSDVTLSGTPVIGDFTAAKCYLTYTEAPDADNKATVTMSSTCGT